MQYCMTWVVNKVYEYMFCMHVLYERHALTYSLLLERSLFLSSYQLASENE